MERHVRQAVVIVHGMGEQRPLETLNEFIGAALAADDGGKRLFYSRPDQVVDSYESRRYLAPAAHDSTGEIRAQTEFFEYHWAHLMQGNRLDDLWPAFRRMLLSPPWFVPAGLRVLWALFWAAVIAGVLLFIQVGPRFDALAGLTIADVVRGIVGGGIVAVVLTYVITRWLPSWLTSSFVDVVRYLDTSPRSYAVRHDIRAGIVDLLQGLHADGRYQRVIIVAHSLGSYIAYDAISYLWGQMDKLHAGPVRPDLVDPEAGDPPDGLAELEVAASALTSKGDATAFQAAQRRLWLGMRDAGNPWLITDFLSFGSPMYMADRIYTRNRGQFDRRVDLRELPTCPPQAELAVRNNINHQKLWFSWNNRGRRVLHPAAPFAVVRWTNFWFPARLRFFGDWFGDKLRPLFGDGIVDVPLRRNGWRAQIPAYAHALYYHFQSEERDPGSVTYQLRKAMELGSTSWLKATLSAPLPDPKSGGRAKALP
ncbi:MAG TPA: hypothetical protein VF114_07155 [Candidatus Limnocylindria bacterium]